MIKIKEYSCYSPVQKAMTGIVGKRTIWENIWNVKFFFRRCPDCVVAEKPIEEAVKSSLPSNGVFIECSVGDRAR